MRSMGLIAIRPILTWILTSLPHTRSLDDDGDHLASSKWIGLVVEYSKQVPEELGVGSD